MSDLTSRTLTIEKVLNAPVKLVWEAWTQSEHIVKWWTPLGMDLTVMEHEFKVGGKWKYTMPMPDGGECIFEGVYKEIVQFEKMITSANFRPMTQNVELQCFFKEDGDNTIFTFNVVHETAEYCKQQEEMGFYNGWGSAFERLDKILAALSN